MNNYMVNHWVWMGIGGGSYYNIGSWAQFAEFSLDTSFGDLFLKVREDPPKTYI